MGTWDGPAKQNKLNSLMEELRAKVKALATSNSRGSVNPRYDSSDVTQNSLLQVLRKQLPESSVVEVNQSWLTHVVKGHLAKLHRFHSAAKRSPEREELFAGSKALTGERPDEIVEQQELAVQVFQALDCLEKLERHVLLEHFCHGTSLAEIARDAGISDDQVREARNRGLKKMRWAMQQSEVDG